jgi:hypothetical protein
MATPEPDDELTPLEDDRPVDVDPDDVVVLAVAPDEYEAMPGIV